MVAYTTAYIGLGSNQDNPKQQIYAALDNLQQLPQSRLSQCSSLYKSSPMGPQDQADFINMVVAVETQLTPNELLTQLQGIEAKQGRIRQQHWGPRSIDLDILLYGELSAQTETLTIPHAGLTERDFVVVPLAEITPHLILPDGTAIQELVEQLVDASGKTYLLECIRES